MTTVLDAQRLSKTFGANHALTDVSLQVSAGRVLGLVGQNGSGKSTLVKVLSGYHPPDSGNNPSLKLRGQDVALPVHAGSLNSLGLSFVHQDHPVVESLTVTENVLVGRFHTDIIRGIGWKREHGRVEKLLKQFNLDCAPTDELAWLTANQRAVLCIAKAVDQIDTARSGVIVLDEPTAALGRRNVEDVFAAIRGVAARGHGVIFVSHRLDEIVALTDDVVVLRDGRVTLACETAATSNEGLINAITGSASRIISRQHKRDSTPSTDPALRVKDVAYKGISDFAIEVHRGEIVGVTGLEGSGYEDVVPALCAIDGTAVGTAEVGDVMIDLASTPIRNRLRAGLAVVLDNRAESGLAMKLSARENYTLPRIDHYVRQALLRFTHERQDCARAMTSFDVRPASPELPLASFSGGNAQKILLAKWIATEPICLALAEPTQGVDVGARYDIFEKVVDLARRGVGILFVSNQIEDLISLCDRLIILYRGRVVANMLNNELTVKAVEEAILTGGEPQDMAVKQ